MKFPDSAGRYNPSLGECSNYVQLFFLSVSRRIGFYGYLLPLYNVSGTAVAQRLRCCATNRMVAGSIPDGVIGIFH